MVTGFVDVAAVVAVVIDIVVVEPVCSTPVGLPLKMQSFYLKLKTI